jgi:acetolactate synthase-1/2/3 large subunit
LKNPDFTKLAESFGLAAYRASTAPELETAIGRALEGNHPGLVHVPCGAMPSPWDLIFMPRVRG